MSLCIVSWFQRWGRCCWGDEEHLPDHVEHALGRADIEMRLVRSCFGLFRSGSIFGLCSPELQNVCSLVWSSFALKQTEGIERTAAERRSSQHVLLSICRSFDESFITTRFSQSHRAEHFIWKLQASNANKHLIPQVIGRIGKVLGVYAGRRFQEVGAVCINSCQWFPFTSCHFICRCNATQPRTSITFLSKHFHSSVPKVWLILQFACRPFSTSRGVIRHPSAQGSSSFFVWCTRAPAMRF